MRTVLSLGFPSSPQAGGHSRKAGKIGQFFGRAGPPGNWGRVAAVIEIDWVSKMGPSTPIFGRKRVVTLTTIFEARSKKAPRQKIGPFRLSAVLASLDMICVREN